MARIYDYCEACGSEDVDSGKNIIDGNIVLWIGCNACPHIEYMTPIALKTQLLTAV